MLRTLENATRNILMKYATGDATMAQQIMFVHRGLGFEKCNNYCNCIAI